MTSLPVTRGSVYLVAHTAMRTILLIGSGGFLVTAAWANMAFEQIDRYGLFEPSTIFSFAHVVLWIVFIGIYLFRYVSEPEFSVTPGGFVIPSRNLCIPWDQIDRVSLMKKSFRIHTASGFLPEADMERWTSKIPILGQTVRIERGDTELNPLVKLTGLNQKREHIVKALTHHLGEDKVA
jgi:hypothetical protein